MGSTVTNNTVIYCRQKIAKNEDLQSLAGIQKKLSLDQKLNCTNKLGQQKFKTRISLPKRIYLPDCQSFGVSDSRRKSCDIVNLSYIYLLALKTLKNFLL